MGKYKTSSGIYDRIPGTARKGSFYIWYDGTFESIYYSLRSSAAQSVITENGDAYLAVRRQFSDQADYSDQDLERAVLSKSLSKDYITSDRKALADLIVKGNKDDVKLMKEKLLFYGLLMSDIDPSLQKFVNDSTPVYQAPVGGESENVFYSQDLVDYVTAPSSNDYKPPLGGESENTFKVPDLSLELPSKDGGKVVVTIPPDTVVFPSKNVRSKSNFIRNEEQIVLPNDVIKSLQPIVNKNVLKSLVLKRPKLPIGAMAASQRNYVSRGMPSLMSYIPVSTKQQVARIAQSVMLPHEVKPLRYSDQYSSFDTAVANPFNYQKANITTGATANYIPLANGNTVAMVFRHPARSMIQYLPSAGGTFSYKAKFANATNTDVQDSLSVPVTSTVPLVPAYWLSTGSVSPHGTKFYSGVDKTSGRRGYWVDVGTSTGTQYPTLTITNTSNTYNVNVYQWTGNQFVYFDVWTCSATTSCVINFKQDAASPHPAYESGYYSFEIAGATAALSISSVVFASPNIPVFAHTSIQAVQGNESLIQSSRIVAGSLLVQNIASDLYREGNIVGLQAPKTKFWPDLVIGQDPISLIPTLQDSVQFSARNGIYGFLKMTSSVDAELASPFVSYSGTLVDSTWPLTPEHDYLIVAFNTASVGGSYPGGDLMLLASWGLEYRTSSLLLDTRIPSSTSLEYMEAIELVKRAVQWHENPLHFGELAGFVRGALSRNTKELASIHKFANKWGISNSGPLPKSSGNIKINIQSVATKKRKNKNKVKKKKHKKD